MSHFSWTPSLLWLFVLLPFYVPAAEPASGDRFSVDTITYKTMGQGPLQADLYRMKRAKAAQPVVVWIHGGALIGGSRKAIPADQLVRLAESGYAVLSISYRLAPETKLPDILEDLKDVQKWLRRSAKKMNLDR